MIIRTFKKSYPPQYLLLIVIQLVLWGGAFLSPPPVASVEHPFISPGYELLIRYLGNSPLLLVTLAFLLVLASALVLNYSLGKNGLSEPNSLMPALFLVLMMSLFPSLQTLHQAMIPGFLIIVVLNHVFDVYLEEQPYVKVFNSGFYIAISSMFYFPSIVFILFVWFTFIVYRLNKWREWIILLFGFITPYILIWTYFFWADELHEVFRAYGAYFAQEWTIGFGSSITLFNYFSLGLVLFLFIRGFFLQTLSLQEKVISVRKRFWAVILFFLVSLATFLLSGNLAQLHLIFMQITFAMIIQGLIFRIKKYFFSELLVWILIALVLFNNYYSAFQSQ